MIERELREAGTISMVRFTFEKVLNASILRITPGSAHHLIACTFGYEFTQKMHAIHGRGEYSVGCFVATIFRIPDVRRKARDQ